MSNKMQEVKEIVKTPRVKKVAVEKVAVEKVAVEKVAVEKVAVEKVPVEKVKKVEKAERTPEQIEAAKEKMAKIRACRKPKEVKE